MPFTPPARRVSPRCRIYFYGNQRLSWNPRMLVVPLRPDLIFAAIATILWLCCFPTPQMPPPLLGKGLLLILVRVPGVRRHGQAGLSRSLNRAKQAGTEDITSICYPRLVVFDISDMWST